MLIQSLRHRPGKARPIEVSPNLSGQGGWDFISFYSPEERKFYRIIPESIKDIRELQRQAAILAINFEQDE